MNKLLGTYLAIVMTLIMLLLAAIFGVLVYGGIKLSQNIQSVSDKANSLNTKIDSFNDSLKNFNPF